MIRVDNLEEERWLFSIITSDTPEQVKQIIFNAIEEFEEKRSI